MNVYTKALAAIRREQMLPPGATVVVGVSGGADSVALLHLLLSLREELLLYSVKALHVNHGLRGEEALRDQRFVEALCERLGVPLTVHTCDVGAVAAERRCGVEEAGRAVRYELFEAAAADNDECRIATAHTASDNVETLLLHLCRGSGLHGLTGIPPVRGRVIRPLIDCTREEIEAYCAEHDLSYMTDSTNSDAAYARNRIRQCVIPQLKIINPRAESAMVRTIGCMREADSLVQKQADALLASATVEESIYDRFSLQLAEPAVRTAVLHRLIGDRGDQRGSEQHVRRAEELLLSGGAMSVSGGRTLTVADDRVCIGVKTEPCPPFCFENVGAGDTFAIGDTVWRLCIATRSEYEQKLNISKFLFANALDCDKIVGSLCLRQRQPGDSYRPAGRGCGKTLKKLFNEAALPEEKRGEVPVLCDSEGIVLIGGFGCDERVRVTAETAKIVWLEKTEDV